MATKTISGTDGASPQQLSSQVDEALLEIEYLRQKAQTSLQQEHREEFGQFFTPIEIAQWMAKMFLPPKSTHPIHLLDAGAGTGSLTAAFCLHFCKLGIQVPIQATLYEKDKTLLPWLEETLSICFDICQSHQINFRYEVKVEDFITASVSSLKARGGLFAVEQNQYDYVIQNPPYRKITTISPERKALDSLGIGVSNLYTAFLWLAVLQMKTEGQIVAIVPRSFCNGVYFRNFRQGFLKKIAFSHLHLFQSRSEAFRESRVLQENIIFHGTRSSYPPEQILISTSNGPIGKETTLRSVPYTSVIRPDDPEAYIRIIANDAGDRIEEWMQKFQTRLKDLGVAVSTGRVVDFRVREWLQAKPSKEAVPLLYPANLRWGTVEWPLEKTQKPQAILAVPATQALLIPSQVYVLVKRFSAKEQKRRISAALYQPDTIASEEIGVENHINVFYSRYGSLSLELAKGLTAFLNSTLVDQYFRQLSGHTQVNANDLMQLRYPTQQQLIAIGKKIGKQFPEQDELDQFLLEVCEMKDKTHNQALPIQIKKKINEAIQILQLLGLPSGLQNDRSGLSLLALLNLRPEMGWEEASDPLLGITEMMNYFQAQYGIHYAPNTRETVRRATIHQFVQIGLVQENPDLPGRPINSPKTKYQIEAKALRLMRTFGSPEWDSELIKYRQQNLNLTRLNLRERVLPMMPVHLPNGSEILLSSGGQNNLIKKIIENFCPYFTPDGNLIYIGDAKKKLNYHEINYLQQLGFSIDPHSKMPDLIIHLPNKNWLVLIEAVTSHGPIDPKRHNELQALFQHPELGLVFVTAFETRKAMTQYLRLIDWQTEVWVAESPTHLIHFNGERFLGPYSSASD